MKFNILDIAKRVKRGFSLTELLIVLVIVAVLFAAMAPIMTNRKQVGGTADEPVWNFVTNAKDIFFDGGVPAYTSAAYFGLNPNNISPNFAPHAKMYIRANTDQNHIQFRYGDGNGKLTGLFSVDASGNLIASSAPENNPSNFSSRGSNNTIAGHRAYANWRGVSHSVGIGNASLASVAGGISYNTAVGANSGQYLAGSYNTLIGANTGRGKHSISNTVAVGGRVLSIDESSGNENVFLGYGVATAGFNTAYSARNTIIGSRMYAHNDGTLLDPARNTIVGYGTYDAAFDNAHDITAVGYNACNSIHMSNVAGYKNKQGPKTCIGYESADKAGLAVATAPSNWSTTFDPWSDDKFEHVFIGGTPNGFNGRSVLEVHNMGSKQRGTASWKPNVAPTVVLNSHLVVRGNLYFPTISDGKLVAHPTTLPLTDLRSTEAGGDRCGRDCGFGRKKWRTSPNCSWLLGLLGALIGIAVALASIPTAGAASVIFVAAWGFTTGAMLGNGLTSLFMGGDYERMVEPPTASALAVTENISMSNQSGNQTVSSACASDAGEYPTEKYCPSLSLSDMRLKENITENTDSLEKIMYIMPYNYTFKNDKDKVAQVGVMAQDLKEYLPDSVFTGKDGYLGIQWDGMFYATINSIKSLDKTIASIDTDVKTTEGNVSELKKAHKDTQKRINELNKRISKLEK